MPNRISGRLARMASLEVPGRSFVVLWIMLVLALRLAPTAVGLQPLPASLQTAPHWLARGGTIGLCIGCAVTATGVVWPRRRTGLGFEAAGYIMTAWASLFYGAALALGTPPSSSAWASGLTFGLAAGCIAQTVVIWLYVRGQKARERLGESPRGGT